MWRQIEKGKFLYLFPLIAACIAFLVMSAINTFYGGKLAFLFGGTSFIMVSGIFFSWKNTPMKKPFRLLGITYLVTGLAMLGFLAFVSLQ